MDEEWHVDVNDSFYPDTFHSLRVNISCAPVELWVAVADPEFPRGGNSTLLFGKHFAENKMKMKEFGPRVGGGVLNAPLVPPLRRNKAIHISKMKEFTVFLQ